MFYLPLTCVFSWGKTVEFVEGVSEAAVIMISPLLKDSSNNFDVVLVYNDSKDHKQGMKSLQSNTCKYYQQSSDIRNQNFTHHGQNTEFYRITTMYTGWNLIYMYVE